MVTKVEEKFRKCLGCRKNFMSASASNRFCPRCKKNADRRSAVGAAVLSDPYLSTYLSRFLDP